MSQFGQKKTRNMCLPNTKCPVFAFTMTELLIVLAIMAILSLGAIPAFIDFMGHSKLKGAAIEVTSLLRVAKEYAITKKKNYEVRIIIDAEKFYIYEEEEGVVENIRTLPNVIDITDVNGATSPNQYDITFYPRGTCSVSGQIFIHIKEKRTADSPENYYSVGIMSTTGRAQIYNTKK